LSNQEAYQRTLEKCHEYIGDNEESLLWFALAETQWKVGRLMPEVKEKALKWLEKGGGTEFLEEYTSNFDNWYKTLTKLKEKLESPMPKEKKFTKLDRNPWAINDVYAYQFHKEESRDKNLFGKYMIIQKIGEITYDEKQRLYMQIHFIDHIFDELPTLNDVNKHRILPSDPLRYTNESIWMNRGLVITKNSEYPKKYLTYLGNIKGPSNKIMNRTLALMWPVIEYRFDEFYSTWRDKEYEIVEEGVYHYTRS